MGKLVLDLHRGVHQLFRVPEALAQVAQIDHQQYAVHLSLAFRLGVERADHGDVAHQTGLAAGNHILHL